ncbi:uncharacterized protein A4U43_C10F4660 [Asparagus officinalis]|uniref:Uncharacterized protein n=1 Tax=Asparagus officinalis TaxID=4686 RepID=A0A5P1E0N9_ASPOF|nr:uncharacterized protein A4U43_C10F4660 [Asparagus officinalis]
MPAPLRPLESSFQLTRETKAQIRTPRRISRWLLTNAEPANRRSTGSGTIPHSAASRPCPARTPRRQKGAGPPPLAVSVRSGRGSSNLGLSARLEDGGEAGGMSFTSMLGAARADAGMQLWSRRKGHRVLSRQALKSVLSDRFGTGGLGNANCSIPASSRISSSSSSSKTRDRWGRRTRKIRICGEREEWWIWMLDLDVEVLLLSDEILGVDGRIEIIGWGTI